MPQTLHPNLGRLAARYDDVIERLNRQEINNGQARGELAALVARDDNGTQWRLNPRNGQWEYRTRAGQWLEAVPPESGYANLTAHQVSVGGLVADPDGRISFYPVDDGLQHPPGALIGSTRRLQPPPPATGGVGAQWGRVWQSVVAVVLSLLHSGTVRTYLGRRWQQGLAVLAVLAVLTAGWVMSHSADTAATAPVVSAR